jgi:type IV pilus assembly protein PilC
MEAGVPDHEALSLAAAAGANRHFDRMARSVAGRVSEGEKMSQALRHVDGRGELPPEFLWYVEVGEESGRLPDALMRASQSAAARAKSALSRLTSLVLPIGVALIGIAVAVVAYAMFDSLSAIQRVVIEAAEKRGAVW